MRFTVTLLVIILKILHGSNLLEFYDHNGFMADRKSMIPMFQSPWKSNQNRILLPFFSVSVSRPKSELPRTSLSKHCKCGIAKKISRIINGRSTKKNEFPWQVGLKYKEAYKNTIFCGGSIISSKSIATAAHCLFGVNKKKYEARNMVVVVAEHDVSKSDGELHYKVCSDAIHPKYINEQDYDYAILTLCDNLQWTRHVKPVCLPTTSDHSVYANRPAVVAGWGAVVPTYPFDGYPDKLQKVWVKTMTNAECCADNINYSCDQITSRMICAIGDNTDSCVGNPLI